MTRPDYAKEIARLALTSKGPGDASLLTEVATYCIHELGYHMGEAELLSILRALATEIEEPA